MKDIARHAGVSPITVSRVVNNSGYVSRETRERVEAAIRELNYVPNLIASSLRSRQSDLDRQGRGGRGLGAWLRRVHL